VRACTVSGASVVAEGRHARAPATLPGEKAQARSPGVSLSEDEQASALGALVSAEGRQERASSTLPAIKAQARLSGVSLSVGCKQANALGAPAAAEGRQACESATLPAEKVQACQPAALRAKGEHAQSPWLLRRRRGDKLANQQRYQLRRHKPVNRLRASMHGLRGSCSGRGETSSRISNATC